MLHHPEKEAALKRYIFLLSTEKRGKGVIGKYAIQYLEARFQCSDSLRCEQSMKTHPGGGPHLPLTDTGEVCFSCILGGALRFCSLPWGWERRGAPIISRSPLLLPCCGLRAQLPNPSGAVRSHLPLTSAPLPDSVALGTNSSSGADDVHEGEPINAAASV